MKEIKEKYKRMKRKEQRQLRMRIQIECNISQSCFYKWIESAEKIKQIYAEKIEQILTELNIQ